MILSNEAAKFANETHKFENELVSNDTNGTVEKEIALDEEVKEKKSMYKQFIELYEAGLSSEEIMAKTNMAKQTFKNCKSRYNKELKTAQV